MNPLAFLPIAMDIIKRLWPEQDKVVQVASKVQEMQDSGELQRMSEFYKLSNAFVVSDSSFVKNSHAYVIYLLSTVIAIIQINNCIFIPWFKAFGGSPPAPIMLPIEIYEILGLSFGVYLSKPFLSSIPSVIAKAVSRFKK